MTIATFHSVGIVTIREIRGNGESERYLRHITTEADRGHRVVVHYFMFTYSHSKSQT
jgi:hypothetical protein